LANSTIYRYEVPVDDRWHGFDLAGLILHVAGRRLDVVEFWALHDPSAASVRYEFRVFGTGQPLAGGAYVGTVVHSALVWHLFARQPEPARGGTVATQPAIDSDFDLRRLGLMRTTDGCGPEYTYRGACEHAQRPEGGAR
jgi:hypothetical protein